MTKNGKKLRVVFRRQKKSIPEPGMENDEKFP